MAYGNNPQQKTQRKMHRSGAVLSKNNFAYRNSIYGIDEEHNGLIF